MAKKKSKLPFDSAGGRVVTQRRLFDSPAYLGLSAQAKALIPLMHRFWRPDDPVGYGIRQAQEEIPCSRTLAMRVFDELVSAGFIVMVDESLFCSRIGSKTRTWRLTWLPFRQSPPTNDWEKGRVSISTGPYLAPVSKPQVSNMDH